MASLAERISSFIRGSNSSLMPQTVAPYGSLLVGRGTTNLGLMGMSDPRRQALKLRQFADNNEFVRKAINRRKNQVAQAKWHLVRLDDPKQPPDPRVDAAVRQLFKYMNPTRVSFGQFLKEIIEDMLILDRGCIEKVYSAGNQIAALWPVDGATIQVVPTWDGSDENAPRYVQMIDNKTVAELRNDELIYIMSTPRSWSPTGWSVVETLVRVIEAELYLSDYEFEQVKLSSPEGLLDLGGMPPNQVDAFRKYYEDEIAGTKRMAMVNSSDPATGEGGNGIKFVPFKPTARESQRMEYHTWLAKKIAVLFDLDPMEFGITAGTNRATAKTQQGKTDEGFQTLASLIEEFLTREVIWHFDENHGFAFDDLTERDAAVQATVDMQNVNSGINTINEIRAREGLDPVPWGDQPYAVGVGPVSPEAPDPNPPQPVPMAGANDKPDDKPSTGAGKSADPFVRAAAIQANITRQLERSRSYLGISSDFETLSTDA